MPPTETVIVGAGLAGLAAALSLSEAGHQVTVLEAAPGAGGRCRSFHDPLLDRIIDNGNHLMMTANHDVFAYLDEIGASDRVGIGAPAAFPFVDAVSGEQWTVRPNAGPVPWWIFLRDRSVPGVRIRDWLSGLRLLMAGPDVTVSDCISDKGPLWERFWEPLAIAALNTDPSEGAARLLANTCRLTFAKGERLSRPVTVRTSLADSLIDPALHCLRQRGVSLRFGERVRGLERNTDGAVAAIETSRDRLELPSSGQVILAVPSWNLADLLPDQPVPTGARMILNLHYSVGDLARHMPPLTGMTRSLAQWLFVREDIVSVTVSAADRHADREAETLARKIWPDVAVALGQPEMAQPPCRVVKERRATFAETPANEPLRPGPDCGITNAWLAGDWTVRGLPATIEGAIRSGRLAAGKAIRSSA
ncbi:MAG: hydroxysqualene dehydroxylase HpnE [Minwuia sp.]|nr:hydroxysqualene dehydroxylase HpnE [Minwuia sp.]